MAGSGTGRCRLSGCHLPIAEVSTNNPRDAPASFLHFRAEKTRKASSNAGFRVFIGGEGGIHTSIKINLLEIAYHEIIARRIHCFQKVVARLTVEHRTPPYVGFDYKNLSRMKA